MTSTSSSPFIEPEVKTRTHEWQRTFCWAASAVVLSQSLQISDGNYNIFSLFWVSISFLFCLLAGWSPHLSLNERWSKTALPAVIQIVVLLQLGQHFIQPVFLNGIVFSNEYALYRYGFILAAFLSVGSLLPRPTLQRLWFPLLLLLHFCLGAWVLRHSRPVIDVWVIQHDAARALLQGINPYTITFPDPYGSTSPWYGEGLSVGGRFTFGYVYPPLSVLMAIPGLLLAGDVRFSNLFAVTATGALLAYARPSQLSFLMASLFLFMPRVYYVVASCWTDAFVVLLFAALLFVTCRRSSLSFLPLGLLLAVKQYLFLGAPLALLLVPKLQRVQHTHSLFRLFAGAVVVGTTITLPFVLWNPQAYTQNALLLNFKQPFRSESLNYSAWWAFMTGAPPPSWLGFLLLLPTYILVFKRCPETPSGFAGATALIYFVFFLFGRQAFINYYFFIFAALCGAVAVFEGHSSPVPCIVEPSSSDENIATDDSASEGLRRTQNIYS